MYTPFEIAPAKYRLRRVDERRQDRSARQNGVPVGKRVEAGRGGAYNKIGSVCLCGWEGTSQKDGGRGGREGAGWGFGSARVCVYMCVCVRGQVREE